MAALYTTQEIAGRTVWFNSQGEAVAHYPDMLLHTLLIRTLEQAERDGIITEETAVMLEEQMLAAWPMHSTDSVEQFNARCALVEAFREAGILA